MVWEIKKIFLIFLRKYTLGKTPKSIFSECLSYYVKIILHVLRLLKMYIFYRLPVIDEVAWLKGGMFSSAAISCCLREAETVLESKREAAAMLTEVASKKKYIYFLI